jgi:hypothetical protein
MTDDSITSTTPDRPWANSPHATTCDIFALHGIDPRNVKADTISANGYETFVLDEHGKRIEKPAFPIIPEDVFGADYAEQSRYMVEQHEWPNTLLRDQVLIAEHLPPVSGDDWDDEE